MALEACILGIAVALSLLCLFYPTEIPDFAASSDLLGPDGFPLIVCTLLIGASGMRLFLAWRERHAGNRPVVFASRRQRNFFLATMALICCFILSFIYIGFYITASVYMLLFPVMIEGWKDIKKRALLFNVVCVVGICYALFHWFKIYLPDTLLF